MTYKDNCGLRKSDFTGVSTPSVLPVLYIIPRPRYTKKMVPVSISIREINRINMLISCDLWMDCEDVVSKVTLKYTDGM